MMGAPPILPSVTCWASAIFTGSVLLSLNQQLRPRRLKIVRFLHHRQNRRQNLAGRLNGLRHQLRRVFHLSFLWLFRHRKLISSHLLLTTDL